MKLIDYLNQYSWSKADLARNAEISIGSVTSALDGQPIARSSAKRIVDALQLEHERLKRPGVITLASVRGLKITDVKRKKTRLVKEPGQETEMKVSGPARKVQVPAQVSTSEDDLNLIVRIIKENPEMSDNAIANSGLVPFKRYKIGQLRKEAIERGLLNAEATGESEGD